MKIFSILLFLFSFKGLAACPNLAGNYTCEAAGETWEMTITQTVENGVTVYQQTGSQNEGTYIADGVARPHTVTANGEEITGTLSTKCLDPKVVIQFLANYQGSPIDFTETIKSTNGTLEVNDITKLGGNVIDSTAYECNLNN